MHHEYAVEPAVISKDWQTCRYIAELFGYDRGRMLSLYPKKWLEMAINATEHLPPLKKKQVIAKLRRLKELGAVRSRRSYDPKIDTWIANALAQQASKPFHAIVAEDNVLDCPEVVVPDDVSDEHHLFQVEQTKVVAREAVAIGTALAPLLSFSNRALLVDKFYNPFESGYQDTLRELLHRAASTRSDPIDLEVHYCEHKKHAGTAEIASKAKAAEIFKGVIPSGMSIKVVCWTEKHEGETFHPRYLLTDCGGVRVDAGFLSMGSHQTTEIDMLDTKSMGKIMRRFDPATGIYEQEGEAIRIDEHGNVSQA